MNAVIEVATAVLLLAGSLLAVLAGVGLQRFPDVFARIHAATKATTLGLVLIVLGAALRIGDAGDAAKLALVAILQFVTAPVAAHMVGRASYRAGTEMSDRTAIDELGDAQQ
jgi:multicomponent Na+:H+ antiporter subunit G